MKLLFVHGWGFDGAIWDDLRAALSWTRTVVWDLGYFGAERSPQIEGPFVAIGHSLGSLLLADALPNGCVGLIALNGFDKFAGDGLVAPRVVERMRTRFAGAPTAVLDQFRERCGAPPRHGKIEPTRLERDLERLALTDARGKLTPRLVLQGAEDPILPPSMRERVFAGAPRRVASDGGHLLPITHPRWCAKHIENCLP